MTAILVCRAWSAPQPPFPPYCVDPQNFAGAASTTTTVAAGATVTVNLPPLDASNVDVLISTSSNINLGANQITLVFGSYSVVIGAGQTVVLTAGNVAYSPALINAVQAATTCSGSASSTPGGSVMTVTIQRGTVSN